MNPFVVFVSFVDFSSNWEGDECFKVDASYAAHRFRGEQCERHAAGEQACTASHPQGARTASLVLCSAESSSLNPFSPGKQVSYFDGFL